IFGQEMDNATSALARMNMILHNNATAKIWKGNTLADPQWKDGNGELKTFDFAVANPPFSNKNWTNGLNPQEDPFGRFTWGIPPEKNGDYAFLLHILKSLNSTGKGAVILPHGVLFRGNAEARIRENLIKQGYIKGIIGLPANLFYGTGIPACIIIIDKEHAQQRALSATGEASDKQGIFMIDASKGFIKDGNKNRLREQDIRKIVDVYTQGLTLARYSRRVSLDEIAANDYNLNIPRYIDASEPEDLHDLSAHLQGGIPNRDIDALKPYWDVFPNLRQHLFKPAREGYSQGLVKAGEVKSTILNHPEFTAFREVSLAPFSDWANEINLNGIAQGDNVRAIITRMGDSLLQHYQANPLLDAYDVFQLLMDYWQDTLQDDVYVITQDGWLAAKGLRELVANKGEKIKETPDLVIGKAKYKAEVIPPALIIARYFAAEQQAVDALQAELDNATQTLESFIEEHSGEEGLLADALNDKDKVTKVSVAARLKLATDKDEIATLKQARKLFETEIEAKKNLKDAQEKLDQLVFKQYPALSEAEIKTLVVEDKWLASLEAAITAEIERVTQTLANRVKELEERYAEPLPAITSSVENLSEKVAEHLKAMGLEWAV
ncbi:MAG: N-6 DNA methylase, partial [Cellvibrio sp.]